MSFFNIKKFVGSIKFAFRGLKSVCKTEQNFRFQVAISILVIILMFAFQVSKKESVVLILMIAFVLVMELINSVFEKMADMMQPRVHIYAELIKNIMSGVVLISALASLIIGLMIFIPYFEKLFV